MSRTRRSSQAAFADKTWRLLLNPPRHSRSDPLALEGRDSLDNAVLVTRAQVVEKGQPQKTISGLLGDWAVARLPAKLTAHGRQVKGLVMERSGEAGSTQVVNQRLAVL